MKPTDVSALIRKDMSALHDGRVLEHVTSLLIDPPRPLILAWPYGVNEETFDGFIVLSHSRSGTGIAYCRHGFGPENPWGLIFTERESPPSTGMDDGWYSRFLDAYFASAAPSDLAIWRIRQQGPGQEAVWVSGELQWDKAWERVFALRAMSPKFRYCCEHAITY